MYVDGKEIKSIYIGGEKFEKTDFGRTVYIPANTLLSREVPLNGGANLQSPDYGEIQGIITISNVTYLFVTTRQIGRGWVQYNPSTMPITN